MPEPLPLLAIGLGLATLFGAPLFERAAAWPRLSAVVLAVAAALLSSVWIAVYLRGGPRIIDATAYFLAGRSLAEGHFGWEVAEPAASTMGRFLVRDTLADGDHAAVIFPPGYPAVLALGFRVGSPMAVGPALAAAVTWLTFDLGRQAARAAGAVDVDRIGLCAAVLSVVCAAMRYHTADTMSHGLTAVCVAGALAAALRLREGSATGTALGLGAAVGLCFAARPVSGLALAGIVTLLLVRRTRLRNALVAAAAAAPFVLFFFVHQRAVTGAWLASSQSLYYAASDGPAGCFRYGFGEGIGCLHEHGDFVRANLKDGFGVLAALGTTLRRLKMHGVDALNAEVLAILIVLPAIVVALRKPATRALGLALPVFAVLYAPFYFDGNYPGGGARFFADVLPVEHVLVALLVPAAASVIARRWSALSSWATPRKLSAFVVAASLLGFGLRAHADHEALRDREGGRPMFRPTDLPPVDGAIVFVDTDHGFLLGFDPEARADRAGVEVARVRGDEIDLWLWEARGRPPAWRHRYDVTTGWVRVEPFRPSPTGRVDAASLWPPTLQRRGFATPAHDGATCAPSGRVLAITPDAAGAFDIELAAPRALAGRPVRASFVLDAASHVRLDLVADGVHAASVDAASTRGCAETEQLEVPAGAEHVLFQLRGEGRVALAGLLLEAKENH